MDGRAGRAVTIAPELEAKAQCVCLSGGAYHQVPNTLPLDVAHLERQIGAKTASRSSSTTASFCSATRLLGLGMALEHDVDHGALEDLTGRALRKLLPELDVLWYFEACNLVFAEVLEDLRTGFGIWLQADHRLDAVAPHLVRHTKHRDLMHR